MVEPVTLERAKLNMRVEDNTEDELIADLITAAREWVENDTGHILMDRQVRQRFGCFGSVMQLSAWPVIELVAIRYTDALTIEQTVDGRLSTFARPALVLPAYNARWPLTPWGEVEVEVRAGYGSETPMALRQAILLLVGHWYANREAVITGTIVTQVALAVDSLCRDFRLRRC